MASTIAFGFATSIVAPIAQAQLECVPTRDAALRVAGAIDHAIASGDIDAYTALFEPLHGAAHAARCAWLRCASSHARWSCSSELLDFAVVAGRGVALLQTEMEVVGPPGVADAPPPATFAEKGASARIRTQRYLVFRSPGAETQGSSTAPGDPREDDLPIALLDIEVDPAHMKAKPLSERAHAVFGCSACNYVVQADETWLLVPHLPERTGCLEAISFYSVLHPITVDIAIQVDPSGADAASALRRVLPAVAVQAGAEAPTITAWAPPRYSAEPPRGLDGRRGEFIAADGNSVELHALAFGSVLYLLTVQGRGADLRAQRSSIDTIFANFTLRNLALSRQRIDLAPITAHTGGKLDGRDYVNDRAMVRFHVPEGFEPRVHCAPGLYHVTWNNASLDHDISMIGFAPPAGLTQWSREAAWMTISNSIAGQDIELDSTGDWQTGTDGSSMLCLAGRMDGRRVVLQALLDAKLSALTILTARGEAADDDDLARYFGGFSRD